MTIQGGGRVLRSLGVLAAGVAVACASPRSERPLAPPPSASTGMVASASVTSVVAAGPPPMRRIRLVETSSSTDELAPRVVPVVLDPSEGPRALVRAAAPPPDGPVGWLVDGARLYPGPNGLLIGKVPPSLGGRVLLVTPDDRFLPLEADDFVGMDPQGSLLVASEQGEARLFELPTPFGPTGLPKRLSVGRGDAPVKLAWEVGSAQVLDPGHVLVGNTSLFALPTLEPLPSLPFGFVEAVRGRGLLVRTGLGTDQLRFELWRAGDAAPMTTLGPPAGLDFDPVGTALWAVDLSLDGRQVAYISNGIFVAKTDGMTPSWRRISAHHFEPGRNGAGLTFSADGTFLCVTEGNVSKVIAITGKPKTPPRTIALPMVTEDRVCEVFFLPRVDGLEPIGESHDRFLKNVSPHLVARDRTWIAALYRQQGASSTQPSPIELIVAEPTTGKLLRRVVVGARPNPGTMDVDQLRVSRRADPLVVIPWPAGGAPRDFGGTFDVRSGAKVAPVLAVDGAPEALGSFCLRHDGAVFPESACEP